VKLETALPEMPGWSADTRAAHANSPTGCRTGRVGRMRTRALMSANVVPPSSPSGFSSVNGHTTPGAGDAFLRFPPPLSSARSDDPAAISTGHNDQMTIDPELLERGRTKRAVRVVT
jgi:hypothetical protein